MIQLITRCALLFALVLPLEAKTVPSCITASKGVHTMPDLTSSDAKAPAKKTSPAEAAQEKAKMIATSEASKADKPKTSPDKTSPAQTPVVDKTKASTTKFVATAPTPEPTKPKASETKTVATTSPAKTTPAVASTSKAPAPTPLPVTRAEPGRTTSGGRLARLTAYWAGEGDYYTGRCLSSTGIHLHGGHCAVDPSIIPYGSVVEIDGVGTYLAVDTGSAVISRTAAKEAGHNGVERAALVIDLFFEKRSQGEHFAAIGPKYAKISWWTPRSVDSSTPTHSSMADMDPAAAHGTL